jgi:hypothetical protein
MLKILIALGCAGCGPLAAQAVDEPVPACPPGEVVTTIGEPVGCDLGAGNVWVILGGTAAHCDHVGGRWVYEACEDADF